MASIEKTVRGIVDASDWDKRVAKIRLVGQNHGTGEHQQIFADVAREAYVPHLAPDFAYVHRPMQRRQRAIPESSREANPERTAEIEYQARRVTKEKR